MFHVMDCIAQEHDLRLVSLAAILCLFACGTALSLIARARASEGRVRAMWIGGAGFVAGSGIWATHFVAMLAYRPGIPVGYDIILTAISIVIAIALCTAGFAIAVSGRAPIAGGALAGAAIGIMHYVGIAALRAPAIETWDPRTVAASLAIGILASALAMKLALHRTGMRLYCLSVLVFTLAICAMHFTGMSAVRLTYDPLIPAPADILDPSTIAVAVAAVATLILGMGMAMAVVDNRMADHTAREAAILRSYITKLETTKHELEQSLEDRAIALTAAAVANKTKSDFLASMSHELRTPLNAIIGFSEMMVIQTFGPLGDVHYRDYVRDIHESGKHLLSLINDILDLSRLDAGKAELFEEKLHVADIVSDCLRMVEPQAVAAGVNLATELPANSPRFLADERQIKQVLINLLSNAVKFTPAGGRITLTARNRPDGLVINVTDTGIGIAPENIAKAFETFGQIDSTVARKHKGTGLGLPLARQLVELHGGTLTLESAVGTGTAATIMLPASRILERRRAAAA
jgi:signal transduction histidine kinase